MKKTHIIVILVIAVAIGVIISGIASTSTYADFSEAFEHRGAEFHVVGTLNREKEQVYDPEVNPDLFSFYMLDENGKEHKVLLHQSKPQDFERSEKIVVIGSADAESNDFHANNILMKCPSKYNDGTEQLTAES